jgi:5-methylcytosine-specific restriction protein B
MIQFHASYSYEDFVQGYRPDGQGFTLKKGVFYDFCKRALDDQTATYVFIIDEINRGNLGKVLGEMMMLLEADKRGSEWSVPLAYAPSQDEQFHVPRNVYLLGMMNTADRSLSLVDYALRRRFRFISLRPCFHSDQFRTHLEQMGTDKLVIGAIMDRVTELNTEIRQDRNLGPGFEIGHSYFCQSTAAVTEECYQDVVLTEIIPLLEEYWFDDLDRVSKWRSNLLRKV